MALNNLSVDYLTDKGVRDLNEDQLVVDEERGVFGVFDGASSLVKFPSEAGETGALIAAKIAAEAFRTLDGDLKEIAIRANENIEDAHKAAGIDVNSPINRFATTAAVVKINGSSIDLLQISDSLIIVRYKDGSVRTPLGYEDHDLEVMKHWRQLADQGKHDIRQLLDDEVLELRSQANKTYGVLNGSAEAMSRLATTSLELNKISSILLLTDGLFLPQADPEAPENWEEHLRICETGGLQALLDKVRQLEDNDPECLKYPRYKQYDDATGIFIQLS